MPRGRGTRARFGGHPGCDSTDVLCLCCDRHPPAPRACVRATPVNSRATKSLQAHWKTVAPDLDSTPTWSVSQEKLAYIPPAEGTVPTSFRYKRGVFGAYLDKAVRLKVNLKSTAHG